MDDMDKPLVSIITVVLNGERHIESAIQSVINQTYKNIEYIILDGQSEDNTIDIIKKYENYISFFESKKDNGLYEAINRGIELSKGSFIKILNSDDMLDPIAIEENLKVFEEEGGSNSFVVNSYLKRIDLNGNFLSIWKNKGKIINGYDQFLHPTWLVPKAIYNKFGYYDESYKVSSDYEYYLRLKFNDVLFKTIKHPLVMFRVAGLSYGLKGMKEDLEINLKYTNIFSSYWHYYKNTILKVLKSIKDKLLGND